MKIFNFLSRLFGNKDFISRKSPIFADFKNIVMYGYKNSLHDKKLDFNYLLGKVGQCVQ